MLPYPKTLPTKDGVKFFTANVVAIEKKSARNSVNKMNVNI